MGAPDLAQLDHRPGAAAFSRRCRGRGDGLGGLSRSSTDPVRAELARRWLVLKLLRRRSWAVHRHVHLVAAFEDAASRRPVRSVLSAGCGTGTSELLLAVNNPDISFTLTDHDDGQLARAREVVARAGLTNVRVERVDLLDPAPLPQHDLVVSIEVLEHIDDDRRALQTMLELSRGLVWVLVPFCDERQLHDPNVRRAAWERHEHVRPGYTHELLAERFDGTDVLWQRNCYFEPGAGNLRRAMADTHVSTKFLHQRRLFEQAAADIRSTRVTDGRRAQGIEILAQVGEGP